MANNSKGSPFGKNHEITAVPAGCLVYVQVTNGVPSKVTLFNQKQL